MSISIRAEHLSKEYRLGIINHGMLYKDMQSWLARKMGHPDPHSKIGAERYDDGPDRFWALKDINFEVAQGERVGLVGRNGAGKSTLLKTLSRITAPTEGFIKIKGRVTSLLEVGTGFHPELTGRDNVYLNGAILGMKRREVAKKFDEIVAFSEIEKFIDTPVKRYSSGMYVRLAFSVAAHLDSEILLADEVLAVGDAAFQKKCLGKMEDVSVNMGRTVIFVSHNMASVKSLCQKGILLERGRICFTGDMASTSALYLSQLTSDAESASKTFVEDQQKAFQVLAVSVVDSNDKPGNIFETNECIRIKLVCKSQVSIPGLYGYLRILNSQQVALIQADSTEGGMNPLDRLEQGVHEIYIDIPARSLGVDDYYIYLNFASAQSNDGFHIDSPGFTCKFSIQDTFSKRGARRGSVTGVIPEWRPRC